MCLSFLLLIFKHHRTNHYYYSETKFKITQPKTLQPLNPGNTCIHKILNSFQLQISNHIKTFFCFPQIKWKNYVKGLHTYSYEEHFSFLVYLCQQNKKKKKKEGKCKLAEQDTYIPSLSWSKVAFLKRKDTASAIKSWT